MAYAKHVSLLVGLAAVTAVGGTLPAHANTIETTAELEAPASLLAGSFELGQTEAVDFSTVEFTTDAPTALDVAAPASTLEVVIPEADVAPTADSAAALVNGTTATSAIWVEESSLLSFQDATIEGALADATVEADADLLDSVDIAQSTRSAYQGVSPFYLGVGGNIGVGDRDATGVSSFGFNVISKIGLGPRFALRPSATITNQSTSFLIPLTYNFDVIDVGGFRVQPYLGAGVDIPTGASVGFVVDAGVDVPISRDFTLNAVSNWRFIDGFGLGISLGVGYNLPFFFE